MPSQTSAPARDRRRSSASVQYAADHRLPREKYRNPRVRAIRRGSQPASRPRWHVVGVDERAGITRRAVDAVGAGGEQARTVQSTPFEFERSGQRQVLVAATATGLSPASARSIRHPRTCTMPCRLPRERSAMQRTPSSAASPSIRSRTTRACNPARVPRAAAARRPSDATIEPALGTHRIATRLDRSSSRAVRRHCRRDGTSADHPGRMQQTRADDARIVARHVGDHQGVHAPRPARCARARRP